jgi:hypothetical protein
LFPRYSKAGHSGQPDLTLLGRREGSYYREENDIQPLSNGLFKYETRGKYLYLIENRWVFAIVIKW